MAGIGITGGAAKVAEEEVSASLIVAGTGILAIEAGAEAVV